jgi:1-deoxy-D-xylulose-5-phosphate reductoisomerase
MKKIALLGSTGSVGRSTLQVVRHLKDEMQIVALAARSNIDLLEQQIKEFHPALVAVFDPAKALALQKRVPGVKVVAGEEGLSQAASLDGADIAMLAMSGSSGLKPALSAISAGKTIGFANKELLVSAGELIMRLVREKNVSLIPVDSEHSAIFQCLQGQDRKAVRRLILTASGGPFRTFSFEELSSITKEMALSHPNWSMGAKITVDSSTLMNKGLEKIEARWLFDFSPEAIDIVVHPQSVVHSCVEYCDGSIIAQMSEPNMVLPIQYALTYPERRPGLLPPFDFLRGRQLTFEAPDRKKFPCLQLAEEALCQGKSYPCVLNAGNEVLVERFLRGEYGWGNIAVKLEKLMSSHRSVDMLTLDSILAADQEARAIAWKL